MAKPTDELPGVSPGKKKKDATQPIDSNPKSPDSPDFVTIEENAHQEEIPPIESVSEAELMSSDESIPKEEAIQPDETSPEAELISSDEYIPNEEALQSTDAEAEFLISDGQDTAAISMQIAQGGGAENVGFLDEDNFLQQVAGVFVLWWHWAYFEITVTSPSFPIYNPPKIVHPAPVSGTDDYEFVYDICDRGYKLSTSKGEEMYSVGMSMCKMFYTIEKMIYILVKRIKDEGIDTETEVRVTFDGHLLAQRKAFESFINLNYNVVVTNFDPASWGERYLEIVKRLSDRGYGYPSEAPREIYKINKRSTTPMKS